MWQQRKYKERKNYSTIIQRKERKPGEKESNEEKERKPAKMETMRRKRDSIVPLTSTTISLSSLAKTSLRTPNKADRATRMSGKNL